MKKLLLIATMGISSAFACPETVKSTAPKFLTGDCLENSPENEFDKPDRIKILVVGKKRYQFRKFDQGMKQWEEDKRNDLFREVDTEYHKVDCSKF